MDSFYLYILVSCQIIVAKGNIDSNIINNEGNAAWAKNASDEYAHTWVAKVWKSKSTLLTIGAKWFFFKI